MSLSQADATFLTLAGVWVLLGIATIVNLATGWPPRASFDRVAAQVVRLGCCGTVLYISGRIFVDRLIEIAAR